MSLYLAGFILFHSMPFAFVSHVSHSLPEPAPKTYSKQCSFVLNVKTVYNSPLGNPRKLENLLKEKGLELAYSEEKTYSYRDIAFHRWLFYLLFEYIPKRLIFEEPQDPYAFVFPKECLPVSSDLPVVASLWDWDLPSYSFILGSRKNVYYSDLCNSPELSKAFPVIGSSKLEVYAYSPSGFYFPGDTFKGPAVLFFRSSNKKLLVFILRDGKIYKTYNQSSVRERLTQGTYTLYAYTYRFRLWKFYFGLRFYSCTRNFYAM